MANDRSTYGVPDFLGGQNPGDATMPSHYAPSGQDLTGYQGVAEDYLGTMDTAHQLPAANDGDPGGGEVEAKFVDPDDAESDDDKTPPVKAAARKPRSHAKETDEE